MWQAYTYVSLHFAGGIIVLAVLVHACSNNVRNEAQCNAFACVFCRRIYHGIIYTLLGVGFHPFTELPS